MSSNDTPEGGQPLVFGVPATTVAAALRGAGLGEDAVIAVLGRTIARSVGAADVAAGASPGFTFQVSIAETAAECRLSYQRLFVHPDFIDGVTVVQAGQTPDEIGFNSRFHSIEAEFDSIARDLQTASNCIAELRREMYLMARELEAKITEMDARIAAKGKDKDTKEGKETKEAKDTKDTKEKDTKEGKDKEGKDTKDAKDKDHKESKDKDREKAIADKLAQIEARPLRAEAAGAPMTAPPGTPPGSARTFITLEDRPDVEAAALGDDEKPSAEPAAPKSDGTPGPDPAATAAEPAAPAAPARKAPAKRTTAKRAASSKATGAAERPTSPPRRRGRGSAEPTDG